jgi:rhodanese-related sulfurtransferase
MQKTINCINSDSLKQKLDEDNHILVIDVRSKEEYHEKHIPAAIHIPLDELETAAIYFSKEKMYVTVCGKGGGRSADAAEKLVQSGYHSAWLSGGTLGWFEQE